MRLPQIHANPDYYDYMHYIELASGEAKLIAGAGQVLHFSARGRYDLDEGRLRLFDLHQLCPYTEKVLRTLPESTFRFRIDKRVFAMLREIPFKPKEPDEAPVVVFPERYLFDVDPLAFAQDNAHSNLYYLTETRDLASSEKIYYPRDGREQISLGEARRRGLRLLSKAEQVVAVD